LLSHFTTVLYKLLENKLGGTLILYTCTFLLPDIWQIYIHFFLHPEIESKKPYTFTAIYKRWNP